MLLRLFVQDMIAVKAQINVFSGSHLLPVAVQNDAELLVAAFLTVNLDLVRRFP